MIKIDNEWEIEDSGVVRYLCHKPCEDNLIGGFVCSIRVLLEKSKNPFMRCKDCNIIIPDEVFNKIKFIYDNRSSR